MTVAEVLWNGTFTILVIIPLMLVWLWGRYCGMKAVMNMMEKELENSNH
jgi:hypothetical protein